MPKIQRYERSKFWSAEITSADERFEALQVLDCLSSGKPVPRKLAKKWPVEIVVEQIVKGVKP
jgi:hypothetical protein